MSTARPEKRIEGISCFTGEPQRLTPRPAGDDQRESIEADPDLPWVGPGLVDLQVNGIAGIDFNDHRLRPEEVVRATQALLQEGITTFLPTLITNSDEHIRQLLAVIRRAADHDPLTDRCIGGIHLEGPFISAQDGARGAHDRRYVREPDWEWVQQCQEVSGGKIRLLTLSPEWEGSSELIRQCRQHNIQVAIGHSLASPEQIVSAVEAGARLSTHWGNAIPLMMPRHPNILWEQLAQDELYASIIADGFHLPDAVLKVAIRMKGDKTILVSDATSFVGMAPGEYRSHIGDEVTLSPEGRLAMKKTPDLLAGAAKSLRANVEHLLRRGLAPLGEAWQMASVNPAAFMGWDTAGPRLAQSGDVVLFRTEDNAVRIHRVYKQGQLVVEA